MIRPSSVGTKARNAKSVLGRILRHVGEHFMAPAYAFDGRAPRMRQSHDTGEIRRDDRNELAVEPVVWTPSRQRVRGRRAAADSIYPTRDELRFVIDNEGEPIQIHVDSHQAKPC